MRLVFGCGVLAVSATIAACGGGGGGGGSPSAPAPIETTLVQAGSVLSTAGPVTTRMRLIQNQGDLDVVLGRLPENSVPPPYSAPNFSLANLLYVEGAGDDDPASAVSVLRASGNAGGPHSINVEYCGVALPGGTHRPFALYAVPPLTGTVTFAEVASRLPDCAGRTRISATLVSSGSPVASAQYAHGIQVATSQQQWNAILQRVPPAAVAPQYLSPDFSQASMVYLEGPGVMDPDTYVRVLELLRASPALQFLYAEFCGTYSDFLNMFRSYAIYSTPALSGDVRSEWVHSLPPNCRVAR